MRVHQYIKAGCECMGSGLKVTQENTEKGWLIRATQCPCVQTVVVVGDQVVYPRTPSNSY